MSNTGYLVDATTRHAIFVERYGHGRFNDLEPILNDMRDKLIARLGSEPMTEFQLFRARTLLADINDITSEGFKQFELDLGGYLSEFSEYEAGFNSRMLGRAVTVDVDIPAIEQLNAALNDTDMVLTQASGEAQRMTVNEAINQFSAKKSREIRSMINEGLISGETTDELAKKVKRAVNGRTKAQARALVSTTISAVSNQARSETAKLNSDIVKFERVVATLDTHTSDICISADKTVWPVGKGPQFPIHFNCRTLRVMVVEDEYAIPGLEGKRAAAGGPVSANLSYRGWLKMQPKEIRERVSIKKTYSLAELAALEPVTFL